MRTQFDSSIKIYSDTKQFGICYKYGRVHEVFSLCKGSCDRSFGKTSDLVAAGILCAFAYFLLTNSECR